MALWPIEDIHVDEAFAQRLPSPAEAEFQGLLDDIQAYGVLVDLIVTKDGLLLDGHRRLEVARKLGIPKVPVRTVAIEGQGEWQAALSLSLNLRRRHLGEAQRAVLGSSLLRIERASAKDRQREAQERGRGSRWHAPMDLDDGTPDPQEAQTKPPDRATERVAEHVGISRQALERVEAVKSLAPQMLQRILEGKISIASAYRTVKQDTVRRRAEAENKDRACGRVEDLKSLFGTYRTVYLDPPCRKGVANNSNGGADPSGIEALKGLQIQKLSHRDGCHFWIWTPWSLIRQGTIQKLLEAWELRWVGELLWDKGAKGQGRWFHARTEVLLLSVRGKLDLLRSDVETIHAVEKERSDDRPAQFQAQIETLSPGPRIHLFAKFAKKGWDHWNGGHDSSV